MLWGQMNSRSGYVMKKISHVEKYFYLLITVPPLYHHSNNSSIQSQIVTINIENYIY